MIVLELDEVEVDHCLGCKGIWLDEGELELLLESAAEKDELLRSFTVTGKTKEKRRKCPICLKKMEKVFCTKETKNVLVDKCRNNHGIWFDRAELYEIVQLGSLDKNSKVLPLLADMFGEKK